VFIWGTIGGVTGVYRSTGAGQNWTRINDNAHQYGGRGNGHFVVCEAGDARVIAQRICDAFAAQPAVLEGGVRLHATVSFGLGCRVAPDTPIGTLLSQADAAL